MEPQRIIDNKHNNPPSELEILQDRLENNYTQEFEEYQRLAAKPIPDKITNEQQAGKLTDHIKAVNALKKKYAGLHKKEKSIYLECGRAVDGWKNKHEANLADLAAKATQPLQAFLVIKAEEERQRQLEVARKAREEAEKLVAEAEAHANEGIDDTAEDLMDAAVQAETKADMITNSAFDVRSKSRGAASLASQKKVWAGEIEAIAAIDLEALRKYFTEDSLQKAINAAVRDGVREIRGVKIYEKISLAIR